MLKVIGKRIFVDGRETSDPLIIGQAFINYVGSKNDNEAVKLNNSELFDKELKAEYFNLVDRKTIERELIIDFIFRQDEFDCVKNVFEKFKNEHDLLISHSTFYNTVNSLLEHEILIKVPQKYKVNR